MKSNNTNLLVTALGATVSGLGYGLMRKMTRSQVGAGVLGFGLAHIALGLLDMTREDLKELDTEGFEDWM